VRHNYYLTVDHEKSVVLESVFRVATHMEKLEKSVNLKLVRGKVIKMCVVLGAQNKW